MKEKTTIAAIATPIGIGGVGVIRISGPKAKEVLKNLWKSGGKSVDKFLTHRLYYGSFIDPMAGEIVDKGLAVWMQAPHSYTGEAVVEIQVHGSPLVLERILQGCLQAGAKPAGPGEFTKRAYLNGKMDLAQAEAVADLIASSSEAGLKQAKDHLAGRLSQRISELQTELVRLRAFVEASIDFPEEDIELIQKEGILQRLTPIQSAAADLLETYREGKMLREGVKVVLVGRPNVGKSSLLNVLLGQSRAIVHHQPGTTRDVIEENCQFGGFLFNLFDTAGIRQVDNEVEAIGVQRSEALMDTADLILWVVDGSRPLTREDIDYLDRLEGTRTFVLINKIDLDPAWNPEQIFLKKDQPRLVKISALTEEGLPDLQTRLVGWVKGQGWQEGSGLRITKLRHKDSLELAKQELGLTAQSLKAKNPVELIAHHLQKAHEALGQITGSNVSESLLDTIFSEFCVGK